MSIGFATQELSLEDKVKAMEFYGKYGRLAFKETEIEPEEIPSCEPDDHQKTPSQRLRAVLFLLWKQTCSHTSVEFDDFYRKEMERIITLKKGLLEDI